MSHCQGLTKSGKKCQNYSISGKEHCQWHDPNPNTNYVNIYVVFDHPFDQFPLEEINQIEAYISRAFKVVCIHPFVLDHNSQTDVGMWVHLKAKYPNLTEDNILVFICELSDKVQATDQGLTELEYRLRDQTEDLPNFSLVRPDAVEDVDSYFFIDDFPIPISNTDIGDGYGLFVDGNPPYLGFAMYYQDRV